MTLLTQLATIPIVFTANEPTPAPAPPAFEGDPNMVTPGVIGFFLTFVVMIAVVLLIIDMVRRIRRVNYRSEVREKLEAELAAQAEAGESLPDADGAAATKPRPEG